MKLRLFICMVILPAVFVGFLGCATGMKQIPSPGETRGQVQSFSVTSLDLDSENYLGLEDGPKELVRGGIRAWRNNSYQQAGELFLSAYFTGKDRGWVWKTDSKIRLLGHSLIAFHNGGAVAREIQTAKYLLNELSTAERKYLPSELKVLLYWATMNEDSPSFAAETPRSLRAIDFAPNM